MHGVLDGELHLIRHPDRLGNPHLPLKSYQTPHIGRYQGLFHHGIGD